MIKDLLIYLLLAGAGYSSYLGFAPYHKIHFVILSVCIFILLVKLAKSNKNALAYGSVFGFSWFFGQLSWIKHSFDVVNLEIFAMPAFLLLCLGLSFFMWLPAYAGFRFRSNRTSLWLAFSIGWSVSELLRSYLFTGFPWNLIGQVWALPMLQGVAYVGILGLSLLTILLFTSLICCKPHILVVIWLAVGSFWYFEVEDLKIKSKLTDIHMRLIQPSIPQKDKWLPELFNDHMQNQIKLSNLNWKDDFDAIIWPEAAIPGFFDRNNSTLKTIAKEVLRYHPSDCIFITGVPTYMKGTLRNSLLVTDKNYSFNKLYHKIKLVPFGEFIPLRSWLPLDKMTFGSIDYTPGKSSHNLQAGRLPPFAALVCYEVIFPHIFDGNKKRPQWILNVTNDGWFGDSIGPWQHLQMARTRAIEQGLPMVRAANDGVSAIIDAKGRILHKLLKKKVGPIDFDLPKALPETYVAKIGSLNIYLCLLISVFLCFLLLKRKSK